MEFKTVQDRIKYTISQMIKDNVKTYESEESTLYIKSVTGSGFHAYRLRISETGRYYLMELMYDLRNQVFEIHKNFKPFPFNDKNMDDIIGRSDDVFEFLENEENKGMYKVLTDEVGKIGRERVSMPGRALKRLATTYNRAELLYKLGVPISGLTLRWCAEGINETKPYAILKVSKADFKLFMKYRSYMEREEESWRGGCQKERFLDTLRDMQSMYTSLADKPTKAEEFNKFLDTNAILHNKARYFQQLLDKYISVSDEVYEEFGEMPFGYYPVAEENETYEYKYIKALRFMMDSACRIYNNMHDYGYAHRRVTTYNILNAVNRAGNITLTDGMGLSKFIKLKVLSNMSVEAQIRYCALASVTQAIDYRDTLDLLYDYHEMASQLGVNPERFPRYLKPKHDVMARNFQAVEKSGKDLEFVRIMRNKIYHEYTDKPIGKYIIRFPETAQELVDEGSQLSHCVGGYIRRVKDSQCTIGFLRLKKEPESSIVTFEINEKSQKIVQARGKSNRAVTDAEKAILETFSRRANLAYNKVKRKENDDEVVEYA